MTGDTKFKRTRYVLDPLFYIVGLLCMGAVPYKAVGADFTNLTVLDTVSIGTNTPTAVLNVQQNASTKLVQLTGTVNSSVGSAIVYGTNTLFLTELYGVDKIIIESKEYYIMGVSSNTMLVISPSFEGPATSGLTAYKRVIDNPSGRGLLSIDSIEDGATINQVTVTDIGNVGLGTTNPMVKLDVHGDVQADGWFYGNFQGGFYGNATSASIATTADNANKIFGYSKGKSGSTNVSIGAGGTGIVSTGDTSGFAWMTSSDARAIPTYNSSTGKISVINLNSTAITVTIKWQILK